MDQTQTDNQEQAQAHAHQISIAIDKLRELHQTAGQNGYRGFWVYSRHINGLFKTLKPLDPDDKHNLWSAYQDVCIQARQQQIERRKILQAGSMALREQVESDMTEADRLLNENASVGDVTSAMEILRNALQKMKAGVAIQSDPAPAPAQATNGSEGSLLDTVSSDQPAAFPAPDDPQETGGIYLRLLKEDREECWRQWQVVRQRAQVHLDERFAAVLQTAQEMVSKAQVGNPPQVLRAIRDLQLQAAQLGMPKERREQVRQVLNEAWKIAITRLQQMREERKVKFQEWRDRMEANLKRWDDQVAARDQTIGHLRDQIDRLQGMQAHARNDEHRTRVQEWINETTEKLRRHEIAVADIRGKISAVQAKLKR